MRLDKSCGPAHGPTLCGVTVCGFADGLPSFLGPQETCDEDIQKILAKICPYQKQTARDAARTGGGGASASDGLFDGWTGPKECRR
jgi:hypothetical protein